jgi:hypothetical protein
MMEFRDARRTILLCSHSMYHIGELCTNTLWLQQGRLRSAGRTSRVIAEYLAQLEARTETNGGPGARGHSGASALPEIIIEDVSILTDQRTPMLQVRQFETMVIQVKTRRSGPPLNGHMGIGIGPPDRDPIFETTTKISGAGTIEFFGEQVTELVIPFIPIQGGNYRAKVRIGDEFALKLFYEMSSKPFLIESDRPEIGMLWMEHQWRLPGSAVPPA